MKISRLLISTALFLGVSTTVAASDYKSVGNDPAIAYDAPGAKGRKVFITPRGMPIETILTYGEWTKVRDSAGDLYWLESKAISPKRMVIVKVANAKVRANPDESMLPVFSADKGVLLELAEPATTGWLKVKHRDGQSGYVKATDVWGGD